MIFGISLKDGLVVAGLLLAYWIVKTYFLYNRLVKSLDHQPGPLTLLSAATAITYLLPPIPYVKRQGPWHWKYLPFKEYGWDTLANKTLYPEPAVQIATADPEFIKEVTTHHSAFPKPVKAYERINFYGRNVLTTEGDEWRMHRKVVAKSFSEQNNRAVWNETIDIVRELFRTWDEECQETGKEQVIVPDASKLTRDLTLMVISAAGFGMRLGWKEDGFLPRGHSMSFKTTLHSISTGQIHRLTLPDWILKLYPFGKQTYTAFEELRLYMKEMIDNRLNEPGEHQDLFSNLLKAREPEKDGESTFSESNLMGNIFVLLFAGHETSANTLALALAALAVYPDVQRRFREQVMEYSVNGEMPGYSDIMKLSYGLAIIYETLRLVPIVPMIPKESAHNIHVDAPSSDGQGSRRFSIPAGTGIVINTVGLHYNPKHWEDPYEFRPERFLGEWNRHAWMPFSSGPRACIGRRFAEIEMLAALTLFVMKYEIRVRMHKGESIEECRKRVLDVEKAMLTLAARKTELVFIRR